MASSESRLKDEALIGLLTSPQAISCSRMGSLTMDLEAGERPVRKPEKATKAPELAILLGLVLGSAGM